MNVKPKENAQSDFCAMIEKSWTWERLTDTERNNWYNMLDNGAARSAVKGDYRTRWDVLQAMYSAFLAALDYTWDAWREKAATA